MKTPESRMKNEDIGGAKSTVCGPPSTLSTQYAGDVNIDPPMKEYKTAAELISDSDIVASQISFAKGNRQRGSVRRCDAYPRSQDSDACLEEEARGGSDRRTRRREQ